MSNKLNKKNNNQDNNKTFENPINYQQQMANITNSIAADSTAINTNHNSKKVSLGPNTKR